MGERRKARIAAFQGVYAWEDSKMAIIELQSLEWMDTAISVEARTFAAILIAGTLEQIAVIDERIKQNLKNWTFDRISKVDLALLRTSTYALIFQKDIPASVTINEAVEIAKKFGSSESYRFVNGILDGIRKADLS